MFKVPSTTEDRLCTTSQRMPGKSPAEEAFYNSLSVSFSCVEQTKCTLFCGFFQSVNLFASSWFLFKGMSFI